MAILRCLGLVGLWGCVVPLGGQAPTGGWILILPSSQTTRLQRWPAPGPREGPPICLGSLGQGLAQSLRLDVPRRPERVPGGTRTRVRGPRPQDLVVEMQRIDLRVEKATIEGVFR